MRLANVCQRCKAAAKPAPGFDRNAVTGRGTGDTITLDGYKASKLSAADFSFGASPSAALAADAIAPGHGPIRAAGADSWIV